MAKAFNALLEKLQQTIKRVDDETLGVADTGKMLTEVANQTQRMSQHLTSHAECKDSQ